MPRLATAPDGDCPRPAPSARGRPPRHGPGARWPPPVERVERLDEDRIEPHEVVLTPRLVVRGTLAEPR
ncbi:hypothetical protein ACWGJB_37225 [Streptomyces sp. NPDC054813]